MKPSTARKRVSMTKQERERYYFEMFQETYQLPAGNVEYRDRPDVIITGAQTLGIEITNFYVSEGGNPSSEQVQRNHREAVVSRAQSSYTRNGGTNVGITFSFDKDRPIRNVDAVAAKIEALAHKVNRWDNGQIQRDHYKDIPELDFVYLYARELQYSDEPDPMFPNGQPESSKGFSAFADYRNRRDAHAVREGVYKPLPFIGKWKVGQLHSFGLICTQRLTEIIREKEEKATDYAPCDAYWLLVVVDFVDAAQEQEIRIDNPGLKSDIFERIVVYKPYFEQFLEILPHPASAR